jgi:murein DD-endopeptidase MepM/ murein hydrolase activator NlpD
MRAAPQEIARDRRIVQAALALLALAGSPLGGCAAPLDDGIGSHIRVESRIRVWTVGACAQLSWPVDGPLSSPFGRRDGRPHDGIDLAVAEGTPVRAACDGVVAYAGDRLRGYGNLIILRHDAALVTVYAHNRRLEVKEGDAVARGQVIAQSGQTGRASAPHLHFEVRQDGGPRDPLQYLSPRATALVHARRVPSRGRRGR